MSKALTRLALALLTASLCAAATAAQTQPAPTQTPTPKPEWVIASPAETTLEWIVLSPEGEKFKARMPKQPSVSAESVEAGALKASGQRYAASADDGTTFAVWAMKGSHGSTRLDAEHPRTNLPGMSIQLDAVAELSWEMLVTREVARLKRARSWLKRLDEIKAGMSYTRDFALSGRPAREYRVWVEKVGGVVYVVADESGAYVVAALGPSAGEWAQRLFLDSFALQSATPTPQLGGGDAPLGAGVGPGRGSGMGAGTGTGGFGGMNVGGGGGGGGGVVDYNRPFRQGEVTKKAVIKSKPEPGFTESARKFEVMGVVRLRAILSKTGEMTNISVVKSLPHGLTERSIAAARRIRFEPAQKDGRAVSQYVVLEYNYNIY